MRTAELIETLVADVGAGRPAHPWRRLGLAAATGAILALLFMVFALTWAPLPQIENRLWFWAKVLYAAALAAPAALLVIRASRPGGSWGFAVLAVPTLVLLMLILGLVQTAALPPDQRFAAWRGATWSVCSLRIVLLSLPTSLCLFLAARTLAPTDLGRAGAAVGLLSGSLAAALYALHCPEAGAAFIGLWYTLGIAGAAAVGAVAGRWLLRW